MKSAVKYLQNIHLNCVILMIHGIPEVSRENKYLSIFLSGLMTVYNVNLLCFYFRRYSGEYENEILFYLKFINTWWPYNEKKSVRKCIVSV